MVAFSKENIKLFFGVIILWAGELFVFLTGDNYVTIEDRSVSFFKRCIHATNFDCNFPHEVF